MQHTNVSKSLHSKPNSCLNRNFLHATKINQDLSKNCTEWLKSDNVPTGHRVNFLCTILISSGDFIIFAECVGLDRNIKGSQSRSLQTSFAHIVHIVQTS